MWDPLKPGFVPRKDNIMAEAKKPVVKKAAPKKVVEKKTPAKKVAVKKTVPKANKAEVKTAEKAAVKEVAKKVAELVETEAIAEAIVEAELEIAAEEEVKTTKAGKHSAKGLKEAEEKAAKEDRKAHASEEKAEAEKPKVVIISRSRLERKGKKFQAASKLVDKTKEYSAKEAINLAIKSSPTKFDSTVELHVRLGVDPRHADQNIRTNIVLPAGTGKKVTVAVLADADDVVAAKKAGAEIAGGDEFLATLDKGVIEFDVLIATPAFMPKLGKYARVLGPKGLMPSPKSGTVTTDVAKAVTEAKAGRVEYRVDTTGIVHLGIGKVSFGDAKLLQNLDTVLKSIKSVKPATVKGNYVLSIYLTTTMGPSIKIVSSEI